MTEHSFHPRPLGARGATRATNTASWRVAIMVLLASLVLGCGPGTGGTGTGPGSAGAVGGGTNDGGTGSGGSGSALDPGQGATPGAAQPPTLSAFLGTWQGAGLVSVIAADSVRVSMGCGVYEFDGTPPVDAEGRLRVPLLRQGRPSVPTTESERIFFEARVLGPDRLSISLIEASGRVMLDPVVQTRSLGATPVLSEPGC